MSICSTGLSQNERSGASGLKPLTVTVQQARRLTGLGNTTVYALIGDGTLESVLVRGRRLILFDSIEKLVGRSSEAA
jgi:excisionase family DNA binding protein